MPAGCLGKERDACGMPGETEACLWDACGSRGVSLGCLRKPRHACWMSVGCLWKQTHVCGMPGEGEAFLWVACGKQKDAGVIPEEAGGCLDEVETCLDVASGTDVAVGIDVALYTFSAL